MRKKLLGILCLIASMTFSSALVLSFLSIGETSKIIQTTVTSLFATILAGVALAATQGRAGFHMKSKIKWYLLRSVFTGLGMASWMHSATHLGPNETTLIFYTVPIWTLCVAAAFGIERIKIYSVIGIAICLAAIVSCFSSLSGEFINVTIAMLSAACFGCYDVVCKKQGDNGEHVLTQAFFAFAFTTVLLTPIALYDWIRYGAEMRDILICISVSPLRFGIVMSIFLAYKLAPISIITPIGYMRLPVMIAMSYFFINKSPTRETLIAGSIIIFTNIALFILSEKRNKQDIAKVLTT